MGSCPSHGSSARHLDTNCFVPRMRRKALGPVYCVIHVIEPSSHIIKRRAWCLWHGWLQIVPQHLVIPYKGLYNWLSKELYIWASKFIPVVKLTFWYFNLKLWRYMIMTHASSYPINMTHRYSYVYIQWIFTHIYVYFQWIRLTYFITINLDHAFSFAMNLTHVYSWLMLVIPH